MRPALFALAVAGISCTFHLTAGESTVGYRSRPLTIDAAVQLALKQNPSVLQQIQQLKAQKGLVYQAQAQVVAAVDRRFQLFADRHRFEPIESVGPFAPLIFLECRAEVR